jgi:hypothetical protein
MLWRETATVAHPLELPDGRLLMPTKAAGRDRLVTALLGKDRVPLLLDSREETSLPAVLLGKDRLAFTTGSGSGRRLRMAALEAGCAHLEHTDLGIQITSLDALAGTSDGKTLYFVQSRQVYEVPADGSRPPQKVEAGDGVAIEPGTGAPSHSAFRRRRHSAVPLAATREPSRGGAGPAGDVAAGARDNLRGGNPPGRPRTRDDRRAGLLPPADCTSGAGGKTPAPRG